MKKNVAIAAGMMALVLMFASITSAGAGITVQANIPFAFYAGKTLVPAGKCSFELRPMSPSGALTSAVLVRGEKGAMAWIITLPGSAANAGVRLHFNKYGEAHFLSKVESYGMQANFLATEAEQEYRIYTKEWNTVNIEVK